MRKLSMKNWGTPAIDEKSESGKAGVSAEGAGARRPRCTAPEPPVDPRLPVCPLAPEIDVEDPPPGPPEVLP